MAGKNYKMIIMIIIKNYKNDKHNKNTGFTTKEPLTIWQEIIII